VPESISNYAVNSLRYREAPRSKSNDQETRLLIVSEDGASRKGIDDCYQKGTQFNSTFSFWNCLIDFLSCFELWMAFWKL
jgi:hypothetical protein